MDLDDSGQLETTFSKQKSEYSVPKNYDLHDPRYAKVKEALLAFLGDGTVWRQGRAQIERERIEEEEAKLRRFRMSLIDTFRKFRRPDFVAIVTWLTDDQLRVMRKIWHERGAEKLVIPPAAVEVAGAAAPTQPVVAVKPPVSPSSSGAP